MNVIVKPFAELATHELYGILQLRAEVFVVEQNCAYLDLDGIDTLPQTLHAFVPHPDTAPEAPRTFRDSHGNLTGVALKPHAYARVLPLGFPDGPAGAPDARSVGRVVTDPEVRGAGLAGSIMAALVAQFGADPLVLNAQSQLQEYYSRFGFAPAGERFVEDGIEHIPMRREAGGA